MSVQLKLLDQLKLSNHLGTNFACSYSEDDRFFIINDTGLYILAFTGSVSNELPKFFCTKHFLRVSNFTPCGNIDIDINSFHNDLERDDLYEMVMRLEYSANLKHTKPIESVPLYAEWSPRCTNGCYLAVLTNTFSLEVYDRYLNDIEETQYISALNITQAVIEEAKQKWSYASRFGIQMKLEEYKKRINTVSISVFTWSHLLRFDEINAFVIFCGHLNGDISVWRFDASHFKEGTQSLTFLGRYHTQLNRITNFYWHCSTQYGGGLFFADSDGKLSVIHITKLNEDKAYFNKEQSFFAEPDKIKIDKISVMTWNDFAFIIIVKQRILIIFGLNKEGEIFDSTSVYIQEYYVTGLHHFDNKILVLSLTGLLTELLLDVDDKKIMIEKVLIPLKSDLAKYRTHGFFFTKNKVFFCILAYPWDLQSFSKIKTYVNVLIYHNSLVKPFELLWKNEVDSICNYWDCFEALRIICIKEKRFPWLGLPDNVNFDTLPLTKLKVLRLVAKISEMVFNVIPSIKSYQMKPFVLLHYLVEIKLVVGRMAHLFKQMKTKELSLFQKQSLFIQNFFLKEMVAKNILPKANVGENFIEDMRSVMEVANELEYPDPLICAWCGDKILGPTCFPPHADSRCCISMMPLFIVPDYKCMYCKSMAHKAVEEEMFPVVCPYCDIIMDRVQINGHENFEQFQTLNQSDCFKDCLKEVISYDEIEDNDVDYIIFSESDEEPEDIRALYDQLSKSTISEIKQEIAKVD